MFSFFLFVWSFISFGFEWFFLNFVLFPSSSILQNFENGISCQWENLKKNFLLSEKGWNTWLQDSLRIQHKEDLTIELNSLCTAELRSPTFPWTLAQHFLLFHHHNSNSLQPFCVPYHYTTHFPTNPPQLVRIGTLVSWQIKRCWSSSGTPFANSVSL